MKFGMLVAALMTMGFAIHANAQSMWGSGVAGGMQSCPYNVQLGDGAQSDLDDIQAAQKNIDELNKELSAAKRDKTKADRVSKAAEKDIRNVIEDDHADFIMEHMDNSRSCSEYIGSSAQSVPAASGNNVANDGEETPISGAKNYPIKKFTAPEWDSYCDPQSPGTVFPAICNDPKAQQSDQDDDNRKDVGACKDGIKAYRKAAADSRKLQRKIKSLTDQIASAKDSMKDAKQAMIDDMKSDTEGGICITCMANNSSYSYQQQNRGTDWASVAGNVATGLLGMYAGYEQNRQTNKMVAQYNSNLGFPTQPVPASYASLGYGLGYINQGLYGAMGGGQGQGGFGCGGSGGQQAGGAFGYPAGMYNPMMGGGMYSPGMMMGGMSGMMMGGMQMGMMAAGYQMGMMMNGGMMTNSGMMIPGMGMMGGGGMPMNGMMSGMMASGMMAGMQMGMMSGMMMSGGLMSSGMMAGGMPMNGMMASGMMAGMQMGMMSGMMMSGGLMSSGMMAGGMPMAGMMMSGGLMASGMQMGMMSSGYQMGMMAGMMSSGMMMDSSMASLQQQMYQQQMSLYQSYMQQQQQKQQVTAGLQQELYGLLYRIQQVQSGVGLSTTGSYLGSTVNSGGINGGTITGGSITNGTTSGTYINGTTATTPLGSGR